MIVGEERRGRVLAYIMRAFDSLLVDIKPCQPRPLQYQINIIGRCGVRVGFFAISPVQLSSWKCDWRIWENTTDPTVKSKKQHTLIWCWYEVLCQPRPLQSKINIIGRSLPLCWQTALLFLSLEIWLGREINQIKIYEFQKTHSLDLFPFRHHICSTSSPAKRAYFNLKINIIGASGSLHPLWSFCHHQFWERLQLIAIKLEPKQKCLQ